MITIRNSIMLIELADEFLSAHNRDFTLSV